MTIKRLPVRVSILAISLMLARAALAQTTGASDIVLRGAEAITVQGGWVVATDAAASGGRAIWLPDAGSQIARPPEADRKSTRLNSSHPSIAYAVFWLRKKNAA